MLKNKHETFGKLNNIISDVDHTELHSISNKYKTINITRGSNKTSYSLDMGDCQTIDINRTVGMNYIGEFGNEQILKINVNRIKREYTVMHKKRTLCKVKVVDILPSIYKIYLYSNISDYNEKVVFNQEPNTNQNDEGKLQYVLPFKQHYIISEKNFKIDTINYGEILEGGRLNKNSFSFIYKRPLTLLHALGIFISIMISSKGKGFYQTELEENEMIDKIPYGYEYL
jgi:hypothetical protein